MSGGTGIDGCTAVGVSTRGLYNQLFSIPGLSFSPPTNHHLIPSRCDPTHPLSCSIIPITCYPISSSNMAPSKPFVGQRDTPKRNPTHGCEPRDVIEPGILWRAFKKQKIIKAAAQRQGPVDAEKPSKVQLPVAKGILSLGEFPMDVFLEVI